MNKLKHVVIGFTVGVAFTLFFGYVYVEELKLQVADDIHYERKRLGNAYQPLLEKISAEDRSEWARNLPETERDVMCSYLDSLYTDTTN